MQHINNTLVWRDSMDIQAHNSKMVGLVKCGILQFHDTSLVTGTHHGEVYRVVSHYVLDILYKHKFLS